jgi:hypothetical protein
MKHGVREFAARKDRFASYMYGYVAAVATIKESAPKENGLKMQLYLT